jgi:hypothetical protein
MRGTLPFAGYTTLRSILDSCPSLPAVLCRHQSIQIWKNREKFEALGVRLVCVLHEWIDREVAAYAPEYWGGELYYDSAKAFHAAVHDGRLAKGNVFDIMNPFGRAWKNMRRVKAAAEVKDSNLHGDGLTLGGVMILAKGGAVVYKFKESTFGDAPDVDELLVAAEKATKQT